MILWSLTQLPSVEVDKEIDEHPEWRDCNLISGVMELNTFNIVALKHNKKCRYEHIQQNGKPTVTSSRIHVLKLWISGF